MNNAPFKVGQKVVCIDDSRQENHTMSIIIGKVKKGNIYTVRGLRTAENGVGVRLFEILTGFHHDGEEGAFSASRFAPIDEPKERIRYVAVSETLREQTVEVAAIETN